MSKWSRRHLQLDSAAEQLLASCGKVMEMYGGPAQYLSEVLRETCDGQLFLSG